MRLQITIILIAVISSLNAQIGDSIKINYKSNHATIQEIINDLESEYGIRFSYATSSWMDESLSVSFKDESIDNVLDYMLSEQDIEYKKINNNILLRKSTSYNIQDNKAYKSSIHLKGKVETGSEEISSLAYAIVMVQNTSIGTYTDLDGKFDLEIPDKYSTQNILVSYVGFEDAVYKLSELKNEYVLLKLSEQSFSISEVTIKNRKKPVRISEQDNSTVLTNTQIKSQISGVMGNDINRSIQLLPGITAHDDDSADIKIRGSNNDQTLMIIDGMPIYNTDHYYGIFSGINGDFVDSINVYKNTYPIQYGGKTAGLIEIFSDRKKITKARSQLSIDLLTLRGKTHIPISKNSTIQIAGRMTPYGVSNNQFNSTQNRNIENLAVSSFGERVKGNKTNPIFQFYDMNGSYLWQDSTGLLLQFNFYRSYDKFENDTKLNIKDNRQDEVDLIFNDRQNWSSTVSSIIWSQPLSPSLKLYNRAYYSHYQNFDKNDINIEKEFKQDGGSQIPQNPNGALLGATHENNLSDYGIDSYLHYNFKNQNIKLGATLSQQQVNYQFAENKENKFGGKHSIRSLGAYAAYEYNLNNKLSIVLGGRVSHYDNLKSFYFSPRALLYYNISDEISLKGSCSYIQQVIRQLYYEYRSEPLELWVNAENNKIPVLTSQNLMIGTTLKAGFLTLDIEAYQKNLTGTLEYAVLDPTSNDNNPNQAQDYQLFSGEGLIRGIDVIASYGYKNYDSYISYSISSNLERYREIYRNQYYASENDRRHQLKWVNTMNIGQWTMDLNGIYSSGRPYTEAEKKDDNGDIRTAEPNSRIRRLPSYFRIDIGTGYLMNIGKQKATLSFSIFNLLNAQNVKYIQSVSTQLSENQMPVNTVIDNESALLNRTFNAGIKIEF